MRQGVRADVMEAISHYASVIDKMPIRTKDTLLDSISQTEKLGIDGFAYALIDKQGYISHFTTSPKWKNLLKQSDANFFKMMGQHLNFETIHVIENKLRFVIRSKDILNTPYLKALDDMNLNNAVLFYQVSKNKMEIFGYIFTNAEFKNIILNNIDFLNLTIANIQKPLETISSSKEFIACSKPALSKNNIEKIWGRPKNLSSRKKIPFIFNNQNILLSTREAQCLAFLRHGSSTKYISDKLNISELTIRDHILNLKAKFEVDDRPSLIKIAQSNTLKKLEGIIHNL